MRPRAICWILFLLTTTGCASSSAPDVIAATTSSEFTTTSSEATTTWVTPTTTTTLATNEELLEVAHIEELEYMTDDEGIWTLDVLYPVEEGPWPLVVVFPGVCDNCAAVTQSRIIAERGAVAVAPRYWHPVASTSTEYLVGNKPNDRAACAVGYAQSIALDYGGIAHQTTIVGFSAGVHPAGWVGLGVADDGLCNEAISHLPVGLVVGDSQFIFQGTMWNAAFENEPDGAAETIDRYLNPDRWKISEDLIVFLWSTESDFSARPIENPPASESWVWSRDTTGTLIDDLREVGALDDGMVDLYDNALLLEKRMLDAGIQVTNIRYPDDHSYNPEVYDRIMEVATGRSG